jgi:hypothetical protein
MRLSVSRISRTHASRSGAESMVLRRRAARSLVLGNIGGWLPSECGTTSATAMPFRVTTKLSPASTRLRMSALLFLSFALRDERRHGYIVALT